MRKHCEHVFLSARSWVVRCCAVLLLNLDSNWHSKAQASHSVVPQPLRLSHLAFEVIPIYVVLCLSFVNYAVQLLW